MKFIMRLILFLLFPFFSWGQNVILKPQSNRLVIQLDSVEYLIRRDTFNQVVTIQLIPTTSVQKELESELGNIDTELVDVQSQIDALQERKKVLNRRKKEVQLTMASIRTKSKKKK